jgi:hypothetical protein
MTRVVVAGALANKAGSAGEAWVRMSWVRGSNSLAWTSTSLRSCQIARSTQTGSAGSRM